MDPTDAGPRFQPSPAPPELEDHHGGGMSYGLSDDGELVHIANVSQGLACNCRCASCGGRLVARKGAIRTQHFAHYDAAECARAWETTLHLLAKRTLMERREILLPPAIARHEKMEKIVATAKEFKYDDVRDEVWLGSIRPDIVITRDGRDLLVEIAVTHPCDSEKIAKLRDRNLPAIEIDLSSAPRLASHEHHVELILSAAPRDWLHNAKILAAEDRLREEADKQLAAELASRSASRRAEAKKLAEAVRKPVEERDIRAIENERRRRKYLQAEALRAFGNQSRADGWVHTEHPSLGATPIKACLTDLGMVACLRLLPSASSNIPQFGRWGRRRRL